jgi:putative ABC transport system permease protein
MGILESVRVALGALNANKLRTVLTMLGMIIGVCAVISLMSIGQGAQAQVTSQIRGMGTNLLFVRPGASQSTGVRQAQGSAATLTIDDADAITREIPQVTATAPEQSNGGQLIANGINTNTRVIGTTPDYPEVRNFKVASGEFITRQHIDGRSTVVVLGANVANTLFGAEDPVGQSVRMSFNNRASSTFRVIGLMESKGGTSMGNQDDQVFVPVSTMQARLMASRNARGAVNVSVINVQVGDEKAMKEAVASIGELLRERHRVVEDDFTIQSQEDFLATFSQITQTFTILLGSIAGISLVVGGIGIMNIMLVSVTERTREIGIRKAVGAKGRDIMLQFLIEAVTLSLTGGAIGILLGVGIAAAASSFGQRAEVSLFAIVLSVTVAVAIGMFFGIYPARRASRLNPIEALRYD